MIISFIGGGNMACALIHGLLAKGQTASGISVIEPDAAKRAQLETDFGIKTSDQLPAAALADVIVLAVKPQQLRDVAIFLGSLLDRQLILSIAAGVRCTDLIRWLGGHSAVVRVMPNTPAQVQAGISALFAAPGADAEQRQLADTVMSAVGTTLWLQDEDQMDAVTAMSGSGPAYVFYFLEAMQQAGGNLGLAPEQARQLALQTFLGAASLAAGSTHDFATLRAQVTSRGGTTERALDHMEKAGIKAAIIEAVQAAAERSRELGDLLGKD
ncbi:pyrroline-5-carboxylate reductase [mine drainage metagenome]|uniref:Pyrroline-5-carboxylate reductase n=1 Tax=mine drainage metagenome TaxID=410659 RepID=A0A1J5QF26_9ZZZZ